MSDIDERYRRATAEDQSRPSEATRRHILANARRVAAVRSAMPADLSAREVARSNAVPSHPRAHPSGLRHWRRAAAGTLAAAALAGLLVTPHFLRSVNTAPATAPTIAPESRPATPPATPLAPPAATLGAPAISPAPPPLAAESPNDASSAAQRSVPRFRDLQTPTQRAEAAGESYTERAARPPSRMRSLQPDPGASLRQAAATGDMERLRTLIDSVDIDARDAAGRTALMLAAATGQAPAVDALLSHGANPNAVDAGGHSPLQLARAAGQDTIAVMLQRAGAH
jgi:hypothetical protein